MLRKGVTQLYAVSLQSATTQRKSLYASFLWMVLASSATVFVEPAPVDLGIMLLFVSGLLLKRLTFTRSLFVPTFFVFLFLMGNLLSMFKAEYATAAVRYETITVFVLVLWFLFVGLFSKHKYKAVGVVFSGYVFAAVTSALITTFSYFIYNPLSNIVMKVGRGMGFFKDPNVFGPFMIPCALYALMEIENTKKWRKIFWILIFMILSIAVLISFSRAAWGNYVAALTVYFVVRFLRKPTFKTLFQYSLIVCILIGSFLYLYSIPEFRAMFELRNSLQGYDADRFANQAFALSLAAENLLGVGPGQMENITFATHNSYLRPLVENGLLGFVGYILFITFTVFKCFKLTKYHPVFIVTLASIIGILINGAVVDTLHWRHFWLVLAIPWGFTKLASMNLNNERAA